MKDFLNYIIIKHSIIYSIHIHNFRKFLLKACILHIISQNSRTAVCLAFLQSYSCFCSELLSCLLSILLIWNLSLVEPDSTVVALKWCVWMCVPRRLYRQSCRHMDLLLSVSFQVNGDIPPRLKKSAHEIILDFIRSRPPLNPVCDLTPPHGWHTCGNMFPPQPVPQNTAPGGLLTLSFSLWLWSLTVNTMPHSFRVHCCPVLKGTDTSPWLQETHTAASSFAVAMVLCSWGSFWRPWIRVFWSGLSVGLCFLCSPLTSPGSTASTHQGLSNPLYVQ